MAKLTSILEKYREEMEQDTIRLLGLATLYDETVLHLDQGFLTTFGIALALIDDDNNKLSKYIEPIYIDIRELPYILSETEEEAKIDEKDKNIEKVLEKAHSLAEKMNKKISIDIMTTALLSIKETAGYDFLEEITSDLEYLFKDILEIFSEEELLKDNPDFGTKELKNAKQGLLEKFKLERFCKILNSEKNIGQPNKILKRDKEINNLWSIISKARKRNAVLVGEPGVGKSAIIEAITHQIDNKTCPKAYQNYKVISLDVEGMIAGTKWRGDSEERFKNLINFLKFNPNVILFIDEVHLILGAGAVADSASDLANALKPILTTNEAIVIGATTNYEYEKYFSKDPALKRRFIKLEVKEPKSYEVYDMIKNQVEFLANAHGLIPPSKKFVEKVILTSACYDFTNHNPDRSIDLMDRIMANAKMKDRNVVTQRDIDEVFSENVKEFKEFSQYEKESTAYHEIGHFIAHYFLPELTQKIIAVTMIPANDYIGATIFEVKEDCNQTEEYYKAEIICSLAGKTAERLISNKLSAGARGDLDKANTCARRMVTEFGFTNNQKIQENITFNDIELSENQKEAIQEEVNKIIKECTKKAEQLIEDHKELIDVLAKELMKKGILGPKELKKLVPETKKETKVI